MSEPVARDIGVYAATWGLLRPTELLRAEASRRNWFSLGSQWKSHKREGENGVYE